MLQKLTAETLVTLDDGRLGVATDKALERIRADLLDRPSVRGKRKLVIELEMVPVADEHGDLESTDVVFSVKDTIPKRQSRAYNMAATRAGLFHNELSKDDVRQRTLDETTPRLVDDGNGNLVDPRTGEIVEPAGADDGLAPTGTGGEA